MIRTTCAWILLLLAVSPVTAPFAACDLRDLVAQRTSPLTAPIEGAAATIPAPAPAGGDAFSVSPLVTRTLPKDSESSVPVRPAHAFNRRPGTRVYRLGDPNRSPHQFSASASVLRI